jgi:hypothetical protein
VPIVPVALRRLHVPIIPADQTSSWKLICNTLIIYEIHWE